jgi:aminopeptidase
MHEGELVEKTLNGLTQGTPFAGMLKATGERLLFTLRLSEELRANPPAARIMELNQVCQATLTEASYDESYANPERAVALFGEEKGRLVCVLANRIFRAYSSAFSGSPESLEECAHIWLAAAGSGEEGFCGALREALGVVRPGVIQASQRMAFDPDASPWTEIALSAGPDDLSYLYRYGERITENDLKTARFVFSMPEKDIRLLAETMTEAFIEGFREGSKDLSGKSTVGLILQAGYERIVPLLAEGFQRHGLRLFVMKVLGTKLNRQADYDHRFDYATYLDQGVVDGQLDALRKAYESVKDHMAAYSGIVFLEVFGEKPFNPVPKPEACKADDQVSSLYNQFSQKNMILRNSYMPRDEISFEIIAFPSPEIEGNFEEIFKDTVRVNTLSNKTYRPVQQAIVDALDGAGSVRIKGSGTNETDLTVSLCPVADPGSETAFINCLASVNIPLGEVFTSPMLKGTSGMLHVEESFLNGLRYDNIRLRFEDGYLTDWSCENWEDPEKGRAYIHENLVFPHKTLPLGEFAIGTNTLVYEMALKHRIMGLLPILILEKMGPHFAIGDTCFSWEEDSQKPCPVTGKTMIAVDNERTILRREDPSKAYTNKHTDVTLPYSSLDSIKAVHPDGTEVAIISGGRFVLPGTELLNEAIEKAHSFL